MKDNPGENPADQISEIADGSVPMFHAELLRLAGHDMWLATTVPEGLAFDGTATAVNAIGGNIYAHVEEELHKIKDDLASEVEGEDSEEVEVEGKLPEAPGTETIESVDQAVDSLLA